MKFHELQKPNGQTTPIHGELAIVNLPVNVLFRIEERPVSEEEGAPVEIKSILMMHILDKKLPYNGGPHTSLGMTWDEVKEEPTPSDPKSLTKENFWNELYRKYPGEMEVFCQWIDSYKEKIGWKFLLGSAVKYHDLPIAFQIGIFLQFTFEADHYNNFLDGQHIHSMTEFVEQMKDFLRQERDRAIDVEAQTKFFEDEEDEQGMIHFDDDPYDQTK